MPAARRTASLLILAGVIGACAPIEGSATANPTVTAAPLPTQPVSTPTEITPQPSPFALKITPTVGLDDQSQQSAAMLPSFQQHVLALPTATRYWIQIDIAFDPLRQQAAMQGVARIRFTNPLPTSLGDMVLLLWPNDDQYRASMEAGVASIADQLVPPEELLGGLAVRYVLPSPLLPGEDLALSLPFRLEASGPIGRGAPRRFGVSQGVLFAPTFYPLVPRLMDGAWEVRAAPPGGDTTNSEVGFYRVEISAPASFDLAATGVEVGRSEIVAGMQTYTYVSGPTRDFAIALGDFITDSREVDGVTVRGWVLPEHQGQLATLLKAAGAQVGLLNDLVGPYPYRELDLVDVPGAYGGIEYPGLVSIGTFGSNNIVLPTIHEVGHQWFYGLIGDDQLSEPWMDEAAATYSEVLYFEQLAGSGAGAGLLSDFRQILRSHPEPTQPIGQAVDGYESPEDYTLFAYFKGALFFDALRAEMGDELFFAFLKLYYETFRYRVATSADFQRLAEQTCTCELEPLFDLWIHSGGEIPGL